ncbi:hypothetical protein BDN72DRAFT_965214 [Pluteus cervinus]|uniref:Uncharacterized protein n=1 Tax=Pluteus cervinus TaxID=181527 RepID=A0ACD3A6N6_9AGAR|nr:hypothetical protein BDN72DRAFT_965214 [Pluteus cervinus]
MADDKSFSNTSSSHGTQTPPVDDVISAMSAVELGPSPSALYRLTLLQEALNQAKEAFKAAMGDSADIQTDDVWDHLQDVADVIEHVKVRRKKPENQKKNIKAISCSKLKWQDMVRFGVTCTYRVAADRILALPEPSVYLVPEFKAFWNTREEEIHGSLEDVHLGYLHPNESYSRSLIDRLTGYGSRWTRASEVGGSGMFVAPEIMLLLVGQRPEKEGGDRLTIEYGNYETVLTGRLDVLLVTMPKTTMTNKVREAFLSQRSVYAAIRACTPGSLRNIRFIALEAKPQGADLEHHLPQVLGQSLGILKFIKSETISWCISTGTAWIFGASQSTATEVRVYVGEVISYNINDKNSIRQVFKTLMYWATQEPTKIIEKISPNARVQEIVV